jgi:hypothetical protein
LPSLFTVAVWRQLPLGAVETQLDAVTRPSVIGSVSAPAVLVVSTRLRKNWYGKLPIGGLPVQVWPLGLYDVQPHVAPAPLKITGRRGSYSS